jgi:hypothetical protein
VASITLDTLLERYGPPDFIKIDTEGHEVEVLRGGARLFAEHHPAIIVEVHRAENGPLVRELLAGYDLTELRHSAGVRQGGPTWLNHFWLTEGTVVQPADYKTISVIGKASGATNERERKLSADLAAYKRLRLEGLQPPGNDGCAALEAESISRCEIEQGVVRSDMEPAQRREWAQAMEELSSP